MSEKIYSTSGDTYVTVGDRIASHLTYQDEMRDTLKDILDKIENVVAGGGFFTRDDGVITPDEATDTLDVIGVTTDTIDESTSGEGVTIEDVLIKDGVVVLADDADSAGAAGTITITGIDTTGVARSTGEGTILFSDATARDSVGALKIMVGTTPYYIPLFAAD